MQEFRDDVPLFLARILGHVCGVIFAGLTALIVWMLYKFSTNLSIGAVVVLLCTSSLAYFFGKTAFKLHGRKKSEIFSLRTLDRILLAVPVFALLVIASNLQRFLVGEIDAVELVITTLLLSACAIFSFVFRKHIKMNKKI